jgi:hypothetical protein
LIKMSLQKLKTPEPDQPAPKPKDGPSADPKLNKARDEGKDLLARLDEATKNKKSGHWEVCCDVRVWVDD